MNLNALALVVVTTSVVFLAGCQPPKERAPVIAAVPVALVDNGQSSYVIYTDAGAPKSVRTAATELQSYIEKVSGAKLLLVNQPREPMIALGNTPSSIEAGLFADKMPLEGFRIVVKGQNVFIVGSDSTDNVRTSQGGTSQGTANGVYAFIEQFLGVRWLMPGENGDYVPTSKTITLPRVDISDAPFFLNRRVPYIQEKRPEVQHWGARQRLGFSLSLTHSHNWQWATMNDFQTHPDWFSEKNGVRMPPAGDRFKLCTSSDSLIREFSDRAIKYFDKHPGATCYSLSPSDSAGWCQCAECKALYEKDPDGNLSVTPAIINFYNKIAQLVAQKYPKKILAGYVYAAYVYPPSKPFKLAPNMFLVWAPNFDYGFTLFRPDVQQRWDALVQQWGKVTDNISYYDLPNSVANNTGAVNPPGLKILKWLYPRLKQARMKGVYVYGNTAWGYAGPVNYLLAKLAWNPDADVDALFDEYVNLCYAEGAPEMKQLYTLLDSATEAYFNANHRENWTLSQDRLRKVYGANFAELERLYRAAEAKITDPSAKARLGMLGANLTILHWNLSQIKAVEAPQNSSFYLSHKAFFDLLKSWEGSLAIAPSAAASGSTIGKLAAVRPLKASNAEAMTPFLLRGDQRVILKPTGKAVATVSFRSITSRRGLMMWSLYNAEGVRVEQGVVSHDAPISLPTDGSEYYQLVINGSGSSFALTVKDAAWALAGFIDGSGLHFLGRTTPLYFEVPEGVASFELWLSSDAPGETAAAKLYTPDGKQVASFRTVEKTVDMQSFKVAPGQSGIWKIVAEKADVGAIDDVFIKLGPQLAGYLSIDPQAVLGITKKTKTRK